MATMGERVRRSWNAFMGRDPTYRYEYGYGSSRRPDRVRLSVNNARTIVNSIYNRIAVDVASIDIRHVLLNEEEQYKETVKDELNNALTTEANLDQTGQALIQDIVMSMFDEGCVAVVPTVTNIDPRLTDSYKIHELRTGKILEWFPTAVRVEVYREETGQKEQIILPKKVVSIIENPFYSVMNEPNSTLQRLIRVLNQLERTNEENSAGKLDLIVQLPYVIKSEARKTQAIARRKEIEAQLTGSQYGIAYIDGTEHVTQLNRSLENNLWTQAKELTAELYNQLGLTEAIFNGTADEKSQLYYYDHTIEPILSAIVKEMDRTWITKTARTQGHAIRYFRNPFKLVPVSDLAEMADKFTRNEIMSSNEIRAIIGMKPSKDPKADQLINSNLNQPEEKGGSENVTIEKETDTVEIEGS